ncbi:MAG: helix-turn-helix domain-containing protein [Bifidobacteriaceae bacterium]|jgi:excisionase family DNA binding protein|nr:helix-turn-helix domain-containing protein [Bifidobacteriaceae bacterium]MDR2381208.1 helix-turn-helix domain-containing protein [Bifidobacteriaceae bacterium]
MSPVLQRDRQALHRALESDGDELSLSLSRETVEFVAQVVDAQVNGQEIVFSRVPKEVSPEDAAKMLGVSRPYVRKLMDQGELPFRKVGSHHRIAVADVKAWHARERKRRHEALVRFSELENDLGLSE